MEKLFITMNRTTHLYGYTLFKETLCPKRNTFSLTNLEILLFMPTVKDLCRKSQISTLF